MAASTSVPSLNRVLLLLLASMILVSAGARAEPSDAALQSMAPPGWKIIYSAAGDLNGDGQVDQAVVIEKTTPEPPSNDAGTENNSIFVRQLLVLLRTGEKYDQVASSKKLLPVRETRSCLEDPVDENAVKITKGQLTVTLNYFMSCGSWTTTTRTLKFRFEHQRVRLIGVDSDRFSRNTRDETQISANLLTGRMTTAYMPAEDSQEKPTMKRSKLPIRAARYLEDVIDDCRDGDTAAAWCN